MITGAPYDVRDLVARLLLHVLGRLVLAFQNSHRNQLERDILLVQHCHDPESCRSIDELDPWSLRIIMLSLLVSEEWFQWNLDNAFISLL